MPWSGDTYSLPAGTSVSAGNTIQSTWANTLTQDIAAAFNTDTPIAAGGTGASTKQGALDNLLDGTTHIDADNLRIADQSDNTKLVDWDVSGVTTGTTRTITVPDANVDLTLLDEDDMASNSATRAASQQSIKAYVDALPFTAEYASTGQTISNAGLLTLAHGLGAEPKLVTAYIQCTSADNGYSIGDKVFVDLGNQSTAANTRGAAFYFDSTNVYVRFPNDTVSFLIANKSSGAGVAITNSNWQLYVRAFA